MWGGLTMVSHREIWLTIVEMKHWMVLVLSLWIVNNLLRSCNCSHIHSTYKLNFVYKYLSVGMELAVIKELFINLHIYYLYFLTNLFWFFYIYWLIYRSFSESLCCDCIFVCATYLPSIYGCYYCVVISMWLCASLCVIVI